MDELIVKNGGDYFRLFSASHIATLVFVVFACIAVVAGRKRLRKRPYGTIFRLSLAGLLLFAAVSFNVWLYAVGEWSLRHSLPLHLSSLSLLLSIVLLIVRSYRLFEFTYFAGIGSAIPAMLTPDLGPYDFPHFRYLQFFIAHGGIVLANIYMVAVARFRPTPGSILRTFIYLNVYMALVFLANVALGSNYMYLMRKPFVPSPLDYMGPWPWYIASLEAVGIALFFFLYLPFLFIRDSGMKMSAEQVDSGSTASAA